MSFCRFVNRPASSARNHSGFARRSRNSTFITRPGWISLDDHVAIGLLCIEHRSDVADRQRTSIVTVTGAAGFSGTVNSGPTKPSGT